MSIDICQCYTAFLSRFCLFYHSVVGCQRVQENVVLGSSGMLAILSYTFVFRPLPDSGSLVIFR